MYQTSDSDSADSDKGIRYKTDSIRNKSRNRGTSSRRDRSPKKSSRVEKKSSNRDKYRDKRKESSHHARDRDKQKYRDREKLERGSSRKNNENKSSFKDIEIVSRPATSSYKTSEKIIQVQENEVKYLGPALPPHLQKKLEEDSQKKLENIQSEDKTSDSYPALQAGPVTPAEKPNKPVSAIASPEESNSPKLVPDLPSQKSREEIECPKEDMSGPTSSPDTLIHTTGCDSSETACKSTNEIIGPILPMLPPNFDKEAQDHPDSREKSKTIGPALPEHLKMKEKTEELVCGPSLPPAMLNQSLGNCLGPTIPPHLREKLTQEADSQPEEEDVYGPVPAGASFSRSHMELEERALEMKIAQLDPKDKKEPTREEWMLELPEVKAANLGLGPRQFRAKAGPDLSDRSSWTDNPQDKAKKKKGKEEPKIDLQREAELKEMKRRDKEQEAIAKKSKRSKESLVEIHTKKLKAGKDETASQERRPFSRDTDLQVNRFDEAQKKAVLKKAQLLDTRFSAGESKFL